MTSAFSSGEPNFSTERAIMAVVPEVTHGTWARRFSSSQIAPAHPVEAAFGFRLPFLLQVAGCAERQVNALVEVVAGLAVAADAPPR